MIDDKFYEIRERLMILMREFKEECDRLGIDIEEEIGGIMDGMEKDREELERVRNNLVNRYNHMREREDEEKVYCKDCRHFGPILIRCYHPENACRKDSWREVVVLQRRKPEEINRNNDCGWFKSRV